MRRTTLALALSVLILVEIYGCGHAEQGIPSRSAEAQAAAASGCGRQAIERDGQCLGATPVEIRAREVRFRSKATAGGQLWLRGTITEPVGRPTGTKLPGVVLVHGSGPMGRDGWVTGDIKGHFERPIAVLRDIAEALSASGYVVLRYDKRTCTRRSDGLLDNELGQTERPSPHCGYPPEVALSATWQDLLGDVEAGADHLAAQPSVDSRDVILVGYSQGTTLALQARQKNGAPFREVVLLAGTFGPIDDVILRQVRWQLNIMAEHMPTQQLQGAIGRLSKTESTFRDIRAGQRDEREIFLNAPVSFWRDWIWATGQTLELLREREGPLFYMVGSDDQNACGQDHASFLGALKGKEDAEVALVGGLSHALHSRAEGSGRVHQAATRLIVKWLSRPGGLERGRDAQR